MDKTDIKLFSPNNQWYLATYILLSMHVLMLFILLSFIYFYIDMSLTNHPKNPETGEKMWIWTKSHLNLAARPDIYTELKQYLQILVDSPKMCHFYMADLSPDFEVHICFLLTTQYWLIHNSFILSCMLGGFLVLIYQNNRSLPMWLKEAERFYQQDTSRASKCTVLAFGHIF